MCVDMHYLTFYNQELCAAIDDGLDGDDAHDRAIDRAEPLYRAWLAETRRVLGEPVVMSVFDKTAHQENGSRK